ncbi:MAG: universal stress protein [Deltaproteobacteria bacterium]|nr:universal stress protein [Deltaproteobacteria bacterium]
MTAPAWPSSILVAVDGSDSARRGLLHAVDLARGSGSKLTVVTAIPTQLFGYRAGYFSFVDRHARDELRKVAQSLLDDAIAVARDAGLEGIETTAIEGQGDVFEQIADHLQQRAQTDIVVLGSFGHSVGDRLILGSTTQRLILEVARRGLQTAILVVP